MKLRKLLSKNVELWQIMDCKKIPSSKGTLMANSSFQFKIQPCTVPAQKKAGQAAGSLSQYTHTSLRDRQGKHLSFNISLWPLCAPWFHSFLIQNSNIIIQHFLNNHKALKEHKGFFIFMNFVLPRFNENCARV